MVNMGTKISYLTKCAGILLCSALLLGSCSDNSTNINKKPPFKTDVHVAGRADSNAVYWKNGTSYKLADNANAQSIDVSDGNVYVAGQTDADNNGYPDDNAVYWKNGTFHQLMDGFSSNSIDVSDGDVYVAGKERTSFDVPGNAVYWKNGNKHRLTEGKPESTATSIYVTKTKVK